MVPVFLATVFIIIAIIVGIGFLILLDDDDVFCKKRFLISIICIIFGIIFGVGSAFIPSQNSLIKSYIVINGRDELTKGNIEKVIQLLDKKSDQLIKRLKK
jgi:hypothetical protein